MRSWLRKRTFRVNSADRTNDDLLYKKTQIGIITPLIEWAFHLLKYAAFMKLLQIFSRHFKPRGDHSPAEFADEEYAHRRIFRVDCYVISWLLIEVFLTAMCLIIERNDYIFYLTLFLAVVRLIEIMQVSVNTVLFDKINIVGSVPRMIIMAGINYLESILLFGLIYAYENKHLGAGFLPRSDGFYFSAITHFTIGYGDVYPTHWLRAVAVIQGLFATAFVILVFARLLAALAPLGELLGRKSNKLQTEPLPGDRVA